MIRGMDSSSAILAGSHDYHLVAWSVLIAVAASYAAFDLAGRVNAARGWARVCWLVGGATATGIGTWSMHFVGMLAFRLPVPVQYHWPCAFRRSRTAFRGEAEQDSGPVPNTNRSVATLAF